MIGPEYDNFNPDHAERVVFSGWLADFEPSWLD